MKIYIKRYAMIYQAKKQEKQDNIYLYKLNFKHFAITQTKKMSLVQ